MEYQDYIDVVAHAMEKAAEVGDLSPSPELGNALKAFVDLVYGGDDSPLPLLNREQKQAFLQELREIPLDDEQRLYYQEVTDKTLDEEDSVSLLALAQAVSRQSEIEMDKAITREVLGRDEAQLRQDVEQFLIDNGLLPLEQIGEADWQGTAEQFDARMAVFEKIMDVYPYSGWGVGRAEAEHIALDHLASEPLQDGDAVMYVGTSAPNTMAFSMAAYSQSIGKNIDVVMLDEDSESAALGQKELELFERLGVLQKGALQVIHAAHDSQIDTLGIDVPKAAVVNIANENKPDIAQSLEESGVETIVMLQVQGLVELLYSRPDLEAMKAIKPLKAVAIPAHVEEELPHGKEIGIIKADTDTENKFWVTPLFFSDNDWQRDLGHPRVIDPPRQHSFAENVAAHPRNFSSHKRIAFAVSEDTADILSPEGEDRSVISHLRTKGFKVEGAVWDDPDVQWDKFDMVVVRSTWDYPEKPEEFVAWIEGLKEQDIAVANGAERLEWNLHKSYLNDLSAQGVNVIPTDILPEKTAMSGAELAADYGWQDVVVKPAVGAGGANTVLLNHHDDCSEPMREISENGDVLVQPFVPEIYEGELSFVFFEGEFSHGVVKQPNGTEFRVHEKFGGTTYAMLPDEDILQQVKEIVDQVASDTTYARVDGVVERDKFMLMELELIDPWLYLKHAPDGNKAAKAFADAIEAAYIDKTQEQQAGQRGR